jgi:hypothetical protein
MGRGRKPPKLYELDGEPARQCVRCREVKKFNEFQKASYKPFGVSSVCKPCSSIREKEYKQRNPERFKDKNLKIAHGISYDDYIMMYVLQEAKCLICKQKFPSLVVDHCHKTGKRRGLLCGNCNIGIGNLQDNPEIVANAYNYLTNQSLLQFQHD